jgi:putative hydrolase of HD superfamily
MMQQQLPTIVAFLTDVERRKLVHRAAYVSDLSRRENSAEHSWHLAVGLLTVAREFNLTIDGHKALVMALIHDACEVDAGDTPVYGPLRHDQHEAEQRCVNRLAAHGVQFGGELRAVWHEYEAQETVESHWVKVLDRLMPFIVNLATHGQTWREQSVDPRCCASMSPCDITLRRCMRGWSSALKRASPQGGSVTPNPSIHRPRGTPDDHAH